VLFAIDLNPARSVGIDGGGVGLVGLEFHGVFTFELQDARAEADMGLKLWSNYRFSLITKPLEAL
jgi:hypothetical protein